MRSSLTILILLTMLVFTACDISGPEEKAIRQMVKTFIAAVDKSDNDLAMACLLDSRGFEILNPDLVRLKDSDSRIEEYLSELIHDYRSLTRRFEGHMIEMKKVQIGAQFFQYKGFSSFKDNKVTIDVDGVPETFNIAMIVRIGDKWTIVSLGSNEY